MGMVFEGVSWLMNSAGEVGINMEVILDAEVDCARYIQLHTIWGEQKKRENGL
jgi:hypothetical protein